MRRRLPVDFLARLAILVIVFVICSVLVPNFASFGNAFAILEGATLLGFVGIGVGLTVLAGELDLSVGSMAALAGVVSIRLLQPLGLGLSLLLIILGAAVVGALQSFIIHALRMSSVVMTLATLIGFSGLAFIVAGEQTVTIPTDLLDVSISLSTRLGIFSASSIAMLVLAIIVGLLLRYSRLGREILAAGGARREAEKAGVRVRWVMVATFSASAAFAATGGALAAIKSGSSAPAAFGAVLLEAVTAILVGGVAVMGGRGGVPNIIVGVLILASVTGAISLEGLPSYTGDIVTGVLLLLVLGVELALERSRNRSRLRSVEESLATASLSTVGDRS